MNNLDWIQSCKVDKIQKMSKFEQKTKGIDLIEKIMFVGGDVKKPPLENIILVHEILNKLNEQIFDEKILKQLEWKQVTQMVKVVFKKQAQEFRDFQRFRMGLQNSVCTQLKKKKIEKESIRVQQMNHQDYQYFASCKHSNFISIGLVKFKNYTFYPQWKHVFKFHRIYRFFQFISFVYVKFIREIIQKSLKYQQIITLQNLNKIAQKVLQKYLSRVNKVQNQYKICLQAYKLFESEIEQFQQYFFWEKTKKIKIVIQNKQLSIDYSKNDNFNVQKLWQQLKYYQIYWKIRINSEQELIQWINHKQKPYEKYTLYLISIIDQKPNLTQTFFKFIKKNTQIEQYLQKID